MFDAAAVRALLAGTRFADVRAVERTGSTNDDVLPLLARADPTPHTIVADHQTHGTGRRGRRWIAAPGSSLLFTTTLPPIPVSALWAVPFWTALCVADGVAEATEIRVQLQWPNDILLDGRKLSGILCVSRIAEDRAIVGCGVGLNVVRPAEPLDIDQPAAFLADYAATTREQVLACILHRFDASFSDLKTPSLVGENWQRRARLAGTPYRILLDGAAQPFQALAKRLGPEGALIVERDGVEEHVTVGDARVVR